jgi:glycosyltransferase involved in cell wall biosynthesis
VSWLTEQLVKQGHDVTLFASGDSITSARLVPMCPKSLRLNKRCIDPLAYHIVMIDEVLNHVGDFDFVHFHVDYLHFPYSSRKNFPHVTTLHGRLDIPDLAPLYRRFADEPVISISNAQRKPLPDVNWQGTVYHGLPQHSFRPFTDAGGYLAFLGRTSPEKGLDQAIEIAKLAGKHLKIAAKVDKADEEYFKSAIQPKLNHPLIEFIGEIGYTEKNAFLGDASAVLFPINWPEPFGLVMIEAMACGTPVIAYPGGSVAEIIEPGVNGFIISGIEQAVNAVKRISEIDRRRCRQRFEDCFTSSRMTQDYVEIYKTLVDVDADSIPLAEDFAEENVSWMKLPSRSNTT